MHSHTMTQPPKRIVFADGISADEMDCRFAYHAATVDAQENDAAVRALVQEAVVRLCALTPPSREQSLMLTALEEAMFWAGAAIARNTLGGIETGVQEPHEGEDD